MKSNKLPIMLSGIQPSGQLCIGNYLGGAAEGRGCRLRRTHLRSPGGAPAQREPGLRHLARARGQDGRLDADRRVLEQERR